MPTPTRCARDVDARRADDASRRRVDGDDAVERDARARARARARRRRARARWERFVVVKVRVDDDDDDDAPERRRHRAHAARGERQAIRRRDAARRGAAGAVARAKRRLEVRGHHVSVGGGRVRVQARARARQARGGAQGAGCFWEQAARAAERGVGDAGAGGVGRERQRVDAGGRPVRRFDGRDQGCGAESQGFEFKGERGGDRWVRGAIERGRGRHGASRREARVVVKRLAFD